MALLRLRGALLGRGNELFVLLGLELTDGSLDRFGSAVSDFVLALGPFFLRVDCLFDFDLFGGLLLFGERDHVFFGAWSFLMHGGTPLLKDGRLRFPHIFFARGHVLPNKEVRRRYDNLPILCLRRHFLLLNRRERSRRLLEFSWDITVPHLRAAVLRRPLQHLITIAHFTLVMILLHDPRLKLIARLRHA